MPLNREGQDKLLGKVIEAEQELDTLHAHLRVILRELAEWVRSGGPE